MLSDFIIDNLYCDNGKLNTQRLLKRWYTSNSYEDIFNEIKSATHFLKKRNIDKITCEEIYCILNSITDVVMCKECNVVPVNFIKKKYTSFCSSKCAAISSLTREKSKLTSIEKYGTDNPSKNSDIIEKIKNAYNNKTNEEKNDIVKRTINTRQERYGYQLNVEKMKETKTEKYGSNYASVLYEKSKETKLARYGNENYNNSEQIKKSRKSNFNGVYCSEEIRDKISKKSFDRLYLRIVENVNWEFTLVYPSDNSVRVEMCDMIFLCKKCNREFKLESWQDQVSQIRCTHCYPYKKTLAETDIANYIKSLCDLEIIKNSFSIIKPYQLDLYLPDYKIAIEYNGLYWHSYNSKESENKNYHLNKTTMCADSDIRLFHIFENEWRDYNKNLIWKSIIRNSLNIDIQKIYARKCTIKEISSKEAKIFLEYNHLQGNIHSLYNIGLFYENELVSLLCMSKSRFNKNYDWEITRFCSKLNCSVVGGFSKLLSYFRNCEKGSIITYADKRYSTGELYKSAGFTELKDSSPNYWYTDCKKLFSRIEFQKHKLKDRLECYKSSLSESQNMFNAGYRRIWDCGNKVFLCKSKYF